MRIHLFNLVDTGALRTFHQYLDRTIRQFQHLQNIGDAADFVNIIGRRLILGGCFLSRKHDAFALFHRSFQRLDRFGATHKQRYYHMREDNDVPQRQQRQLGLFSICGGCHGAPYKKAC